MLAEIPFKSLIFDEVQELRHDGTKKYAVASMLASQVDLVWGLSGTPIYNYGIEIYNVLNILDHYCLGDRGSFTREWCVGYGEKIVEQPDVLNDHLRREGLLLRRLKEDVQEQLPPKRRVVEQIDHDGDIYDALIQSAIAAARRYDNISKWREKGQVALEIEADSRLASGLSKVPAVVEFIAFLLEGGERPLVFAWHHQVHEQILEKLRAMGWNCGEVTGRRTRRQQDEALQAFKNGDLDMLQMSLRTAAGVDGLQERASCVVFPELDWSPGIHSQCEDRAHRMDMDETMDSLMCYYLVATTGYDGVVQDALGLKVGQFAGVMGDEPETESDRVMAQKAARTHLSKIIEDLKSRPFEEIEPFPAEVSPATARAGNNDLFADEVE